MLNNFIDGEPLASEGESEPILNPATGEELARASKSTAEDVDRAVQAARRAFAKWSTTTPAQRAQALLALADLIDEHAPEIARLEALNAGKPIEAVTGDELPVMADNLRFFAGAARCLEGRAAGEYMEGYTSFTRREAVGVIGQITPELPADDGHMGDRPCARRRQYDRAQTGRDDADHDRQAGRARRGHLATGRAERRHRPRAADGRGPGSATPRWTWSR